MFKPLGWQQQCTFEKQCSCESQCYESISQAVATCFFLPCKVTPPFLLPVTSFHIGDIIPCLSTCVRTVQSVTVCNELVCKPSKHKEKNEEEEETLAYATYAPTYAPVQSISTIVHNICPWRPLFVCLITLETPTTTISFSFNLSINRTWVEYYTRQPTSIFWPRLTHVCAGLLPGLLHLSGSVSTPLVWKHLELFSFEQN